MAPDGSSIYNLFANLGIGGALLWYVVRRLDEIKNAMAEQSRLYTILILSLPHLSKRAKDDVEAISKRINEQK